MALPGSSRPRNYEDRSVESWLSAREGAAGAVHHCKDSKFKLGPLYLRPGNSDFSKFFPDFSKMFHILGAQ